jgi:hypothetical protein
MEVDMELTKKTTLLFPPDFHEHLSRLAHQRGVSLGEESRLAAVRELAAMSLPVGNPEQMERESVPAPESLAATIATSTR